MSPALLPSLLVCSDSLTKEDLYQADDNRDHHHIVLVEDVGLVVRPGKLDTEDTSHQHTDDESTTAQPLAKP